MIVGIDAHAKSCTICEMSARGKVLDKYEIPTTHRGLDAILQRTPKNTKTVLESSTVAKPIYRHLKKGGLDVHMANPRGIKMVSPTCKNDEKDAERLANLLRSKMLPESYVPSPQEEEIRTITRFRYDLVRKTIEVKNQVHSILKSNLVGYSQSDLFGKAGIEYLKHVKLSATARLALNSYLRQLGQLREEIAIVDKEMTIKADAAPKAKLLMSIPGVDYYSALVILGEIGDISRFPSSAHLSAYAGLVPRIRQSGEIERSGRITKSGSPMLRWILTNNAWIVVRNEGKLKRFYSRLAKKKGSQRAIVAVAHKMLVIIYHMLTKNQLYEERNDEVFERKVTRLEFKARRARNQNNGPSKDALAASGWESMLHEPVVMGDVEDAPPRPRSRHGQTARARSINEEVISHHPLICRGTHKRVKTEVEDIGK